MHLQFQENSGGYTPDPVKTGKGYDGLEVGKEGEGKKGKGREEKVAYVTAFRSVVPPWIILTMSSIDVQSRSAV
jgi:hypothetical protein